jgi:hypothetical protein
VQLDVEDLVSFYNEIIASIPPANTPYLKDDLIGKTVMIPHWKEGREIEYVVWSKMKGVFQLKSILRPSFDPKAGVQQGYDFHVSDTQLKAWIKNRYAKLID